MGRNLLNLECTSIHAHEQFLPPNSANNDRANSETTFVTNPYRFESGTESTVLLNLAGDRLSVDSSILDIRRGHHVVH